MPPAGRRPRNLVFCRVGDRSLHRAWLGDPATRSYDVWLDSYASDDGRYASDPARVTVARDTVKIQRIAELAREHPELLRDYDALWFPDDDLAFDAATAERLFEIFHALELQLAQPSLAEGSYFGHAITLENRSFSVRFTNYVEPMAPVFSRAAFQACWPTFAESVSGWGIDNVWPKLLGYPTDRLAIVDETPVLHTRPIGSSAWYRGLKIDPMDELVATAARHGIKLPYRLVHFGGLPRGTLDRSALVPPGPRFAWRIVRGAPRSLWKVRRFWNRHLQAIRYGRRQLRAIRRAAPRAAPAA